MLVLLPTLLQWVMNEGTNYLPPLLPIPIHGRLSPIVDLTQLQY